ncbi:TetR/AcrR family transcriptional regulator [Nocardia yunnanensis]|uniref:TetR/AcrR family transcriptional regulator n=1 Tax=Nocardia yunnanensis TaxID=2382165 RepID=A0A386Z756_9NOCA|nr:TetR/AcrR family transcriptional regulator [Nocardia yunnanensis]AYF72957.1 TetR/AcrR family transcriptional regulator [Nocardia yunnanensis]
MSRADDGSDAGGGVRVRPKRAETRQRLLDAAFEAFAEEGFGRCSVEQVCERAGFTRGAFYSNFTSLEELFLAMWEQRSATMLSEVASLLDTPGAIPTDPRRALETLLAAVPMDDKWFRITSEFTAHALRNPDLRQAMVARETAIAAALTPVVVTLLGRTGRHVPNPTALGRALVAVHDGTLTQSLLEPDNPTIPPYRLDLFLRILDSYSEPTNPSPPADSSPPPPTC